MTKLSFKILACVFLGSMGVSCASLNSVSMTGFPKNRSNMVSAKVDKFVFLAFNFNNDFVLDLVPQLQNKCPGGKVTGITTKYETRYYFIGYKMIVTSEGFCQSTRRRRRG